MKKNLNEKKMSCFNKQLIKFLNDQITNVLIAQNKTNKKKPKNTTVDVL